MWHYGFKIQPLLEITGFRSDLRFPASSLVLYIWQHFGYKKFCHLLLPGLFCVYVSLSRQWRLRKKFKWKAFLENHKCWWLVSISGHMQVLRTLSNTFLNYPFLVADKINLHLWKVPSLGLLGCCEASCVLKVRVSALVPKWQSNIRYLFIEKPQTHHHEFHVWCMSHRPASHQARQAVLQSTGDSACLLCSGAGVLFDLLGRDKALLRGCIYLRNSLWWVLSFVRVELCACSISLNKHHISFSAPGPGVLHPCTVQGVLCWPWQGSTQSKGWIQWILSAVSCTGI